MEIEYEEKKKMLISQIDALDIEYKNGMKNQEMEFGVFKKNNEELKQKLLQSQSKEQANITEINKLKESESNLSFQIDELNQENVGFQFKTKQLENTNQRLQQAYDNLKQNYKEIVENSSSIDKTEQAQLTDELFFLKQEKSVLQSDFQNFKINTKQKENFYETEMQKYQSKISELQSDGSKYNSDLSDLKKKYDNLKSDTTKTIEAITKENQMLKKNKQSSDGELNSERQSYLKQIAELQTQIKENKKEANTYIIKELTEKFTKEINILKQDRLKSDKIFEREIKRLQNDLGNKMYEISELNEVNKNLLSRLRSNSTPRESVTPEESEEKQEESPTSKVALLKISELEKQILDYKNLENKLRNDIKQQKLSNNKLLTDNNKIIIKLSRCVNEIKDFKIILKSMKDSLFIENNNIIKKITGIKSFISSNSDGIVVKQENKGNH